MALDLPVVPPVEPMLAKAVDGLPDGDGWLYEPKWDGFRAIVFRDGDEVFTQSRDLKPLDRYFPELAAPLRGALPNRAVVDGEVVIARDGALDFEALLLRIHPAASRVNMLAAGSPASFVAWDLLALDDEDLRDVPQGERDKFVEVWLQYQITVYEPSGATVIEWPVSGYGKSELLRDPEDAVQRAAVVAMREAGATIATKFSEQPQIKVWLGGIGNATPITGPQATVDGNATADSSSAPLE